MTHDEIKKLYGFANNLAASVVTLLAGLGDRDRIQTQLGDYWLWKSNEIIDAKVGVLPNKSDVKQLPISLFNRLHLALNAADKGERYDNLMEALRLEVNAIAAASFEGKSHAVNVKMAQDETRYKVFPEPVVLHDTIAAVEEAKKYMPCPHCEGFNRLANPDCKIETIHGHKTVVHGKVGPGDNRTYRIDPQHMVVDSQLKGVFICNECNGKFVDPEAYNNHGCRQAHMKVGSVPFEEMMDYNFIRHFNFIQWRAYINAKAKGFHPANEERNIPEMLCLIHGEVSECLEWLRQNNPMSDHIPEFTGAEEELADVVIRVMDLAQMKGWRVAEAILAKMTFNVSRPFKHGKTL